MADGLHHGFHSFQKNKSPPSVHTFLQRHEGGVVILCPPRSAGSIQVSDILTVTPGSYNRLSAAPMAGTFTKPLKRQFGYTRYTAHFCLHIYYSRKPHTLSSSHAKESHIQLKALHKYMQCLNRNLINRAGV